MYFYDTCALLNLLSNAFKDDKPFYISSMTLKELEHIKTAANKDADVKFRARRVINLLANNEDKYELVPYSAEMEHWLSTYSELDDSNDSRIIISALYMQQHFPENNIIFMTDDLCCQQLAKCIGVNTEYIHDEDASLYKGFKEIVLNEQELIQFYNKYTDPMNNDYNMLINEYLIIKNEANEIIDQYKYTEDGFKPVPFISFESRMFGTIKPKDIYQRLVMDSMKKNKITVVRGAAGTGKSYLSFGYLFSKLEHHDIDKIVIFCNTVATSGSAKLGYYPGSRDEKLLDSQIGNFLSSKIGDKIMVEDLIAKGQIVLLPMSDIRGYDTTGMHAGIYITEAQNLDIELMRLALQRIGDDSICVLDGDSDAQVDLPVYAGNNNGMRRVSEVFRGDPCYGEITLQNIHRSRIAKLAQNL